MTGEHQAYWRSLDELLDTPEFRATLAREFPQGAARLEAGMSRRHFVQLLGASLALAGLGACVRRPDEEILPYTDRPPEVTPGEPLWYATSMTVGGYATGLLVESHEGRPTKVEGNPDHPSSLGAAGPWEQASVLQLYDPERLRGVWDGERRASWEALERAVLAPARASGGAGLRLLLEPTGSPLLAALLARLRAELPEARVHWYDPLANDAPLVAARAALGAPLLARPDLRRASVIASFDADVLGTAPGWLRHAREWSERRRVRAPGDDMSRLYVAESAFSVTGSVADHRVAVRPHELPRLLAALLAEVVAAGAPAPSDAIVTLAAWRLPADDAAGGWVRALARDLRAANGAGVVLVGERQPAAAHVLGMLVNAALGQVGRTVAYAPSPLLEAGEPSHDLGALAGELHTGAVDTLLVVDANPAYASAASLDFANAMRQVRTTAYVGLHANETAALCRWRAPLAHWLESWGDARAHDGTVSLVQPLIAPLHDGRSVPEVLALLLGDGRRGRRLLRDAWAANGAADEEAWRRLLRAGVQPGTATPTATPAAQWTALPAALEQVSREAQSAARPESVAVHFLPSPAVRDGRFANVAWLQELPDPLTKLTWGNAALVSPRTATALGVRSGDVLRVRRGEASVEIPALVLPGHADGTVSLHLGYGRTGGERLAAGVGVNAYPLWPGPRGWFASGATVEPVPGARVELATTQDHWTLEGSAMVLGATLEEWRRQPDRGARRRGPLPTLHDGQYAYTQGDQWAMAIDLSLCTGCNACVVACQAENNVPVVGKEGVEKSREMHWLRIDRYFSGTAEAPAVAMQPMLCQHCEKAPCEYVCPVNATVHSPDGLNEMVYARCVGTRFCSNNCPYKVRRFNWFDYAGEVDATVELVRNPDVTVRERGVMEKCTFCVQRIRRGQQQARVEDRALAPGEVVTACQQACPTQAIVFGSRTSPDDELARRLADRRGYEALHALGTRPRVSYLARLSNPSPELPEAR